MQDRFELIQPHYSVIDIGCAPGSFLQAIRIIVREKTIIGVDLKECKPFSYPNVTTLQCDIFDYEKPVGIQIFGGDEDSLALASKIVDATNPDLLDINFGCPVKKVALKGAGAGAEVTASGIFADVIRIANQ